MILTNDEIAKIFALYWGSIYQYKEETYPYEIVRYNIDMNTYFDTIDNNCKLLLKSIFDISDEDAIEVAKLSLFEGMPEVYVKVGKDIIERVINHEKYKHRRMCFSPEVFLYLISKGYAIPLYLGHNHWANGKTAIELGIAIYDEQYSKKLI